MLVSAWLVGCAVAPPPRTQIEAAAVALDRASQADADALSPVEFDFARRQLAAAETAFEGRDYEVARRMALQAQVNAELAAAKARAATGRAAVHQRTQENEALRRELLGESGR
ncbi:MAG TPA: DUF4398 domain-containing protein [Xanthomonadaceae bacterium]|nr:DUF4398 domain-containing protein [Xanthomonadaceae bacterium]